jgi:hypothetical protein
VSRAAGENKTMQENIQDWLQLDEGDTGFWLLVLLTPPIVLNFLSIYFLSFFYLSGLSSTSLIWIIA